MYEIIKIMNIKVGLDVDGVLANFELAMAKQFNKPHLTSYGWDVQWISDLIHKVENDEDFWENLPLISHPESITFDFDYYITAVPPNMKGARERWLRKNGFPDKPVIVSDKKLETMLELGVDVLIDDKTSTIKEVHEAGLCAIHFIPPYMICDDIRINNIKHLSQVNDKIDEYKKIKELVENDRY